MLSTTGSGDDKAVPFPATSEEHAKRVLAEAQRLANGAPGEWLLWIGRSAEQLGVQRTDLEALVKVNIQRKEKEARERKAEEQRIERQRAAAERDEQRKRDQEQRRLDKEAEQTRKAKEKAFAALLKLPSDQFEAKLAELARRLGEDPDVLREDFEVTTGCGCGVTCDLLTTTTTPAIWNVVPWDEPVDVARLLQQLDDQIRKYVVIGEHYRTAAVLWTAMDWIHNEVATHSPILDVVSVDEGSGKTQLVGVLGLLTQRPLLGAEFTGPNIYRTIDRDQPTLIIDEADDAFQRRPDLKHIVNASWTRGTKIPRQVRITGESQTHLFDIFCPKIIGHVLLPGKPLPRTIASRGICIKMWPKRPDEHVEEFQHCDDDEFATLRRKLLRFANDHAKAIAEIKPTFPAGFNNRLQANWKLLMSVAELAGGDWPKRAREAAKFIAGKIEGSQGTRLFTAFYAMCVARLKGGAAEIVIPSEEAVAFLRDFDSYWANDYRGSDGHSGEITQKKLAALTRCYEIRTATVHPTKRGNVTRGAYVIFARGKWDPQWLDMFARYCPELPDIQTLTRTG